MKIYNNAVEITDLVVTDESYRYRVIMGENSLTITFSLPEFIEIPVGSYVNFQGEVYTLQVPQNFTKNNSESFEYTLILQSAKSLLSRYKFRDSGSKRLKFSFTAKPSEHLEMLVWNLNQRDSGWSVGDCIDSAEKVISFNHTNCDEALRMISEAFKTEYEVIGKVISLKKVEYNKTAPLALSYGFGNGFKSGVKRDNFNNSKAIEILFVQGGEKNIDATAYGSQELLLPKSQELIYEGRTYVSDENGYSIRRQDKPLSSHIEDSLDLSNIYPSRVGVISDVVDVDVNNNFYDFIDASIPNDLNFTDCLIAGEKMTVIFQSGMLSGKEFDVSYKHSMKKFEIVPQDIDGIRMPNETFKPAENDKYAVFGISLPDAYVCDNTSKTGGSWDMFREAAKYMFENEDPRFSFTGELDGIWSKNDWLNVGGKIKLGGFVSFTDEQFQNTPVLIRIVGIKDYINNPYSPQIELSNVTVGNSTSSAIKDLPTKEVAVIEAKKETIRFAKRGFREAKETFEMVKGSLLENFTGSINPITVQTMQIIAGDESLQFKFVNSKTVPVEVPHSISFDKNVKVLSASAGIVQHMTLGITSVSSSHAVSEYKFWDVPAFASPYLDQASKSYWLYLKCSKSNQTATFVLSEVAIAIESVAGYYHLLVGMLNSEFEGDRSWSEMYGYSELTPSRLTIKKIVSPTGNVYFDLEKNNGEGEIGGHIKFVATDGSYKTVDQAIGDIQIGGVNLISGTSTSNYPVSFSNGIGYSFFTGLENLSIYGLVAGDYVTLSFGVNDVPIGYLVGASLAVEVNGSVVYVTGQVSYQSGQKAFVSYKLPSGTTRVATCMSLSKPAIGAVVLNCNSLMFEKGNKATDWSPSRNDINTSIADAKQTGVSAQNSANTANSAVSGLNTYVDGVFKDGVIDTSEAQAIDKLNKQIDTDYNSVINDYNVVYANSYLEGSAKTNLLNAKINLVSSKDALQTSINNAIADGKTTPAEKTDVNTKFTTYSTNFKAYQTALSNANKAIQVRLDSLSTDKVNNLQIGGRNLYRKDSDITAYNGSIFTRTLIGFNISGVSGSLATVRWMSAFPVISDTYTLSFEAYSNVVGAPFFLQVNDITIATVVMTGAYARYQYTFTPQQQQYNFIDFQDIQGFDYFFKNIKLEKGNKATDWSPAPEDVQVQIDASNALLSDIASDNKLTPNEKQQVKKEWDDIYNEFPFIRDQGNDVLGAADSYEDSYSYLSTYITPLLSNLTTTSDIVGSTFRGYFRNYYLARETIKDDIQRAIDAQSRSLDFVKSAVENGSAEFQGGLGLINLLFMKNLLDQVTGGMSGLDDDNVGFWTGGTYTQALADASKAFKSAMSAAALDKKDGSGHRAFGKLAWDVTGQLYVNAMIEAVSGKIGGLNIFENTLASDSMEFSESPVESLASLLNPSSVSISRQSIWTSDNDGYSHTQQITFAFNAVLKFKGTTISGGQDPRWGMYIRNSAGANVSSQLGVGNITNKQFIISLPAGTYYIQLYSYGLYNRGETITDFSQISGFSSVDTITALGYVFKTKIGNNGFFSFWDVLKYFYFSATDGLSYRGAIDVPAGMGGASIASNGLLTNGWGLAHSSTRSTTTTTIKHNVTDTKFTVNVTPKNSFTWYLSSITAASSPTANDGNVVIICTSNTAVFDVVIVRTPY